MQHIVLRTWSPAIQRYCTLSLGSIIIVSKCVFAWPHVGCQSQEHNFVMYKKICAVQAVVQCAICDIRLVG